MKKNLRRAAVLLGSFSALALSGCGGGSTPTPTQSVSGVVADGYLKGATVCLDTNLNKKCDSGEPSGVTIDGGKYSISSVSSADLAKYPIVVEVPAGAVDSERGAVASGYVLTAPAGRPEFISPLTTLVQSQIETNGLSLDEAETIIKNQLGLTNLSPLADYKPGLSGAVAEERMAAGVAKVIATTIAENKKSIEAAVSGSTSVNVQQIVNLIVQQVMQNLASVVQNVRTATNNGSTALAEGSVSGVVSSSGVTVSTSDMTALKLQLAMAGSTATASTTSDLTAILVAGMYGIDGWYNGNSNEFEYRKIVFAAPNSLTFPEYKYQGTAWVLQPDSNDDIYLTTSGWKAETGSVASFDPATGVYSSPSGQEKMTVRATTVDTSSQLIYPYLKNSISGDYMIDNLATFPAGSLAYRMTFVPVIDVYRLSTHWNICKMWNNNTNSCSVNYTSLTEMISSMNWPSGNWTNSDNGNYRLQFGSLNVSTNSGTLYIGAGNTSFSQNPIATSVYKLQIVHGVQVLLADLTPVGGGYTLFGMYNGSVMGGEYRPKGVAELSSDFNFNKTAMTAIMKSLKLPTVVAKQAAK